MNGRGIIQFTVPEIKQRFLRYDAKSMILKKKKIDKL